VIPCGGSEFPRQQGDFISEPEEFIQERIGIITDKKTALNWLECTEQPCTPPRQMTWQQARQHCQQQQARLPTVMELNSLLSLDTEPPKINQKFFSNTQKAAYWTITNSLTPKIDYQDKAWFVHFGNGSIFDAVKTSKQFVRCVK